MLEKHSVGRVPFSVMPKPWDFSSIFKPGGHALAERRFPLCYTKKPVDLMRLRGRFVSKHQQYTRALQTRADTALSSVVRRY